MSQLQTTTSGNKDCFDSSSVTQELSFLGLDDSISSDNNEVAPSCVLLSDYESDSLADLSYDRQDSLESVEQSVEHVSLPQHRTGGLRRKSSTSSHTTTTTSSGGARSVRFADAHIRKYAVCVGDNPAVSLGVPVSLDWQVLSEEICPVDTAPCSAGLTEEELRLPSTEREAMVRNAGFSTEEIRTSVRAVNTVKMEREQTLDTLKNAGSEYLLEKIRKGVWNATIRRRSKKMERALLRDMLQKDAQRSKSSVVLAN